MSTTPNPFSFEMVSSLNRMAPRTCAIIPSLLLRVLVKDTVRWQGRHWGSQDSCSFHLIVELTDVDATVKIFILNASA